MRLVLAISRSLPTWLVREARTWVERALSLPEAAKATIERAALLYCKGVTEFLADQIALAELSMSRLLTLSRERNLILGQAGAFLLLGTALLSTTGNASRAETAPGGRSCSLPGSR